MLGQRAAPSSSCRVFRPSRLSGSPVFSNEWEKQFQLLCGGSGPGSPEPGEIAIFDRTWYGRVLVEQVEGFAKISEWRRAYEEINVEAQWVKQGIIVQEFWMQIDAEEQLKRFQARENDPNKTWKIFLPRKTGGTGFKWDAYVDAVNRCSTGQILGKRLDGGGSQQ